MNATKKAAAGAYGEVAAWVARLRATLVSLEAEIQSVLNIEDDDHPAWQYLDGDALVLVRNHICEGLDEVVNVLGVATPPDAPRLLPDLAGLIVKRPASDGRSPRKPR